MPVRLSSPIENLRDHYTVVVVGSGYGGGIAASRLARAGQDVCVLERGKEFVPGEFPDTQIELTREMQADSPGRHIGSRMALFDFRGNNDMNVLVGCGLGGTSLINANVSLRAEPRVFDDERWPQQVRDDLPTLMEDGYRHAEEMLKPSPYPDDYPPLRKLEALRKSAEDADLEFYRPPINVNFAPDGVNHVGVEQLACRLCGDCCSGCNFAAKNTTQMNYLPDARNHGAEIFTQVGVRRIERRDDKWLVHYQLLETGREKFDAPTLFVTCDVLVLAAGTLGSTEILLRSKAAGLPLSDRVGDRFSGNGDVLAFAYNCDEPINGIGVGSMRRDGHDPVGPTITGIIDLRNQPELDRGFVVEDAAIPSGLHRMLPAAFAAATKVLGQDTDVGDSVREARRELASLVRGAYHGAVHNTQTYLVMSHDDGDGRMHLEGDKLRIDWPGVGTKRIFQEVEDRLRKATVPLGGTYTKNPIWSKLMKQDLITVHPLGGCVMADDADTGVVDHRGRPFAGTSGDAVHDGLFVLDGSIVPRPLGVNPLLTISALAERGTALLAQDRGWTIDYALTPRAPAEAPPRPIGIRFTERMHGSFSTAETGDFEVAARRGERDGSRLEFTVTVIVDDVERMVGDEQHRGRIIGTVLADALSPKALTVTGGEFNLFVADPDDPRTRRMQYRMRLQAEEGKTYFFDGFKLVHDDPGLFDPWTDTTTLFITVHEGETDAGPIAGRGILKIANRDFVKQMTTLEVLNAPNRRAKLKAQAQFGRYFAGALFSTYGGIFARSTALEPEVEPRRERELRVEPPAVEFVPTGDGTSIRLSRYEGGEKGPVLLAHGIGNSSRVFTLDTVDTNLVEFLALNGYDVWLLDWRGSVDLPTAQSSYSFADVVEHDWPTAIEHLRNATGSRGVHVVADGIGSATLFAALGNGLEGVESVVALQTAAHLSVPKEAWLARSVRLLTDAENRGAQEGSARFDADAGWRARMLDRVLRHQPLQDEERCDSPVCHRATFLYGLLYEHDQLNEATHETLHELLGIAGPQLMDDVRELSQRGDVLDASQLERLQIPIAFVHGAESEVFLPDGIERTYNALRERFGKELYSYHPVPNYGHLDCLIGKDAVEDVYPLVLSRLEAAAPEPALVADVEGVT